MNHLEEQEYLPFCPWRTWWEGGCEGVAQSDLVIISFPYVASTTLTELGFEWTKSFKFGQCLTPSSLKRKDICDIHSLSLQEILLKTPNKVETLLSLLFV